MTAFRAAFNPRRASHVPADAGRCKPGGGAVGGFISLSAVRCAKRAALGAALAAFVLASGCARQSADARNKIEPVYDKDTGRLQLLKYDSNGNGKIDTWSYMDGARTVRIEIDKDEAGTIDRWEYYGSDGKLEKVGLSRANDGKPDSWVYANADGSVARIEVSTKHDGKANRVEYFEKGAMVRAEEDTDGDGKIDKWETYEGQRLASVAFDLSHSGRPERRLVYLPDDSVRVEVDRTGSGAFVEDATPAKQPARARQ